MSNRRAFTITDSAANVVEYIEAKKVLARGLIAESIDSVNSMMASMVRDNLSGIVLKDISGRLKGTVVQRPTRFLGNSIISGTVTAGGPAAPYGVYFEEGGTHEFNIIPIHAKSLMFMMEGQKIFARLVHHPPIPLLPWFGPAVAWGSEQMATQLDLAMKEVADVR